MLGFVRKGQCDVQDLHGVSKGVEVISKSLTGSKGASTAQSTAKSAGTGRRSPSLDLTGAQDLIFSHLIFSFNIFPEFSISGEKKKNPI